MRDVGETISTAPAFLQTTDRPAIELHFLRRDLRSWSSGSRPEGNSFGARLVTGRLSRVASEWNRFPWEEHPILVL